MGQANKGESNPTTIDTVANQRSVESARKLNLLFRFETFRDILGYKLTIEEVTTAKDATKKPRTKMYHCVLELKPQAQQQLKLNKPGPHHLYFDAQQTNMIYHHAKQLYICCGKSTLSSLQTSWPMDDISFEDHICTLCYKGQVQIMLKCEHSFCKDCLKLWFEKKESKECPACRTVVELKTQEKKVDGFRIIEESEENEFDRLNQRLLNDIKIFGNL